MTKINNKRWYIIISDFQSCARQFLAWNRTLFYSVSGACVVGIRLRRFKWDPDEICQERIRTDWWVWFRIWRHACKMAVMSVSYKIVVITNIHRLNRSPVFTFYVYFLFLLYWVTGCVETAGMRTNEKENAQFQNGNDITHSKRKQHLSSSADAAASNGLHSRLTRRTTTTRGSTV